MRAFRRIDTDLAAVLPGSTFFANVTNHPPPLAISKTNGIFQVRANGAARQHLTLQATPALPVGTNWTALTNGLADTNGIFCATAAATNLPQRFYRALSA